MLFPQDQWAYSCKPLAASMDEKGVCCTLHLEMVSLVLCTWHAFFHGHFVACQALLPGGQQPSLLELSEQLELHSNMTWTPKITTWIHQVDWLIHRTYQVTDMT